MTAPAASTENRLAVIVFNPTKSNVDQLREAVARATLAEGWDEPLWLETSVDDPGAGVARQAVERGADVVLASGGDGTIRSVAAGLRDTGVPLAIVPAGTGNLLARNLALPLGDVQHSVAIALTGGDKSVDLGIAELNREDGCCDTEVFLVMAGLGIDAAMFENTNSALKQKVGWLAYVDGALRTLPTAKPIRIQYSMHDRPEHTAHVSTILAGNCGALPGNMDLMPDARLDDGLLDIAILQPRSIFGWLTLWRKVTWENRVLRRSAFGRRLIRFSGSDKTGVITYLRGKGVNITAEEPQPVELDGDGFGVVTGMHLWADEGALIVKVPAGTPR